MDSFGDMIRKLREGKSLPLRTVAAFLDIDQAILSKIERGHRKPTRVLVIKLAKYFKVNENDLLVAWLSDKPVYEVEDEEVALKALKMAEEKFAFTSYKKVDKSAIRKTIRTFFRKDSRIIKAWLFGSFARGEDDYKSDIDILIEVPANSTFSLFDIADVKFQLEKLVSKNVDIVMKDALKGNIRKRIEPDLKVIYER